MKLNTDNLNRCIQTFESSLALYEKAAPGGVDSEVFRNAIVKGFELTQEIEREYVVVQGGGAAT